MAFIDMDAGDTTTVDLQIHFVRHDDDFFVLFDGKNLARPADDARDSEYDSQEGDVVAGHETGKTKRTSERKNERPRSRRREQHDSRGNLAVLRVVRHDLSISRSNKRQ